MSTTEIRTNATDQYTILDSYNNSNNLELCIAQALVQSSYGNNAITTDTSGNYISPVNNNSWTASSLDASYVNTSAIANYPNGTLGEYSVISTALFNSDVSYNIYYTTLTDASFAFQSLETSSAYYDSNYVFTQSLLPDCSDNVSGTFVKATFDLSNASISNQYATQSRWNTVTGATVLTTVGPDPVSITQDVSLNTLQSFAKQGSGMTDASYVSYWAALKTSNGDLSFNIVNTSYQPIFNNLLVGNRDMSGVTLNVSDDVGIFRIQQPDNVVTTQVAHNGGSFINITANDLNNMPLFDGGPSLTYNSAKSSLPVPGTMTISQFQSLVNPSVYNNICDGWQFEVDISSNGGGYTLPEINPLMSSLDNSNLLDNPYYMANYVSNPHSISFSDATVTIDVGTNGVTTDAASINVDLTSGETLQQTYAGVNGQIIINTNTPTTRIANLSGNTNDLSGNSITFTPNILYSTDSSTNSLSLDETVNPYFEGMWQKVAQQSSTTDPSYYLKESNSAIMTLYSNGIVDSSYNANDFTFSFNNVFGETNDIQLWKLNSINNLIINPQSFYSDASYTIPEDGISTAGVLLNLAQPINYDQYRVLLTAKTKEDIGLYNAVANGWSLNYITNDPSADFLTSSSTQAYGETTLPIYNSTINTAINNGSSLNFLYEYKTTETSNKPGGLTDYVEITYWYSTDPSENVLGTVTIPQSDISRIYVDASSSISYTVISDSSYSFTGFFDKAYWELVYVHATSVYNASFNPNYGSFTNLLLTVENIQQNNLYYAVRNKITGNLSVQAALRFVVASDINDLTNVYETITPYEGNSLQLSGIFNSTDLQPFMSVTQGQTMDTTWNNITNSIQTDVYYGFDNSANILNGESIIGTILTNIEYTPFTNSTNSSINVYLNDLYYYIPINYDSSGNNYSLSSYSASSSTITTNTDIGSSSIGGNLNTLNLSNGYADVTTWDTSAYTLITTFDPSNEIITFTINETETGTTVFTIVLLNNTIFLGQILLSYIPLDYYRVERLLGNSSIDASFNEQFTTEDYTDGLIDFNLSGNLQGIQITNSGENIPVLGNYQQFRIIGDYMNINEVGSTTSPTSANELGTSSWNDGSLIFKYVSGQNYSAAFDFPTYRGYNSFVGDQNYIITRDATSVTFTVSGQNDMDDLNQELAGDGNMYYGETFTVNNLQDSSSNTVANLNIAGTFNYSIPPSSASLTYTVTVTGDSASVTIVNPNYIGSVPPVVDPNASQLDGSGCYTGNNITLNTYGIDKVFTFSGTNWNSTNAFMAFRPSRVKLNNANFAYNSLKYRMAFSSPDVNVYKALTTSYVNSNVNWLGNPAQAMQYQNPNVVPPRSMWVLYTTLPISQLYTGIKIGVKNVYQNPNLAVGHKLSYIISVPPYYKFEQMASNLHLPYNYSVSNPSNTTMYSPYISIATTLLLNTFNPFASTVTYYDINGNSTIITNNATLLNNITFTLLSPPSITNAVISNDQTRYGIIVKGTNISVSLYSGLYNSTVTQAHTNPIWNGPITSLPSTPNINTQGLIFRSRDATTGAISFSALQYPADIGYPAGPLGYIEILGTDNSYNWYNIDFNVGNTGWFNNNNPITYFDMTTNGVRPTLYTVLDINNSITQINRRRVYKYTLNYSIPVDASGSPTSNGYQTFNLIFNGRQYCDFDISSNPVFSSTPGYIWNYNTMLNNTIIPNSNIVWTTDTSYNNLSYVSWSFGNSVTSQNMIIQLFSVEATEQKFVYIHLEPFMRYLNQFNLQVGSVAWDSSVTCPLLSTRVVNLAPGLTNPVLLNNTYTIEQQSESTL